MQRITKKMIGLLLAVILCLSCTPLSALAADAPELSESVPVVTEAPVISEEPEVAPEPEAEPTPTAEPTVNPTAEPSAEAMPITEEPKTEEKLEIPSKEPVKTVGEPLVKVVFNFYDAYKNAGIESFDAYNVESTHSYNALARVDGESISIAANKYPGVVEVSTEALRFRVLYDEGTDVTELVFVFDSSAFGGKKIVVFEKLYRNEIEIAAHADIEDEMQTVTVRKPGGGAQTGGDGLPIWALILGIACAAGGVGLCGVLIWKSRKKGTKQNGR